MFTGNKIKRFEKGIVQAVPFCKNCNSQNIEIVKTCKDCGSHNISMDIFDDRARKVEYIKKEIPVYKCDKCGKEFDGLETGNIITYIDGIFKPFKCEDESSLMYTLQYDLCEDCKKELVYELNKIISRITFTDNIQKEIEKYLHK